MRHAAPHLPARVVVVEDDPALRLALTALLEREPCFEVVGEAVDGLAAIRLLERLCTDALPGQPPAAMVVDLTMPRMDGSELVDQLLEIAPNVRLIVHSGGDSEVAGRRIAAMADEVSFVQRGEPQELVDGLRRTLGLERRRRPRSAFAGSPQPHRLRRFERTGSPAGERRVRATCQCGHASGWCFTEHAAYDELLRHEAGQ